MCLGGLWGMGGRAICIAGWNCVRWWVWVWQWLAALLYNEGVSLLKIEGGWEVRWVVWGFHNGPLAAVLSVKLSKCHHLQFQHTPNRWLPVSAFISPTQNHIGGNFHATAFFSFHIPRCRQLQLVKMFVRWKLSKCLTRCAADDSARTAASVCLCFPESVSRVLSNEYASYFCWQISDNISQTFSCFF